MYICRVTLLSAFVLTEDSLKNVKIANVPLTAKSSNEKKTKKQGRFSVPSKMSVKRKILQEDTTSNGERNQIEELLSDNKKIELSAKKKKKKNIREEKRTTGIKQQEGHEEAGGGSEYTGGSCDIPQKDMKELSSKQGKTECKKKRKGKNTSNGASESGGQVKRKKKCTFDKKVIKFNRIVKI